MQIIDSIDPDCLTDESAASWTSPARTEDIRRHVYIDAGATGPSKTAECVEWASPWSLCTDFVTRRRISIRGSLYKFTTSADFSEGSKVWGLFAGKGREGDKVMRE